MRPRVVLLSVALLVAGTGLATGAPGAAQQATPAASGITGVAVETLGRGLSSAAPGYTLLLPPHLRARRQHRPAHPPLGTPSSTSNRAASFGPPGEGTPLLTRAAAAAAIAAGTPTPPGSLAAGEEVVLELGDAVFYDGQTSHAVRNARRRGGRRPLFGAAGGRPTGDHV